MSFGASADVEQTKTKGTRAEERVGERTGERTREGTRTEQLVLDQTAIERLIEDALSGPGGLAEIFAGEQTAGIFGSSVAAQAAGDLTSKLVGELAKLTGVTETKESGIETNLETELTQITGTERGQSTTAAVGTEGSFKLFS